MPLLLLALFLAPPLFAQSPPAARFESVAQRWVRAFNAEDYASMEADFSARMLSDFPTEKSKPFYREMAKEIGKIKRLGPARFIPPHQALFHAQGERGDMDIRVFLDENGKIEGLRFLPPSPEIPVPDRNATRLSLPFSGEWLVRWGGDTLDLNHHHDVPNQRFAFDFVITDGVGDGAAGATHRGDGSVNEDYFAFGREVLAPADGTVVEVINGVRDNVPGSMNPYSALGNAVLLRHAGSETSVLAHLKLGSLRVRAGDDVKRGQLLGLCGNSGNSSEPHLHYHLQNTPVIQDGTGIKVFFQKIAVRRGGASAAEASYSPVQGDVVSPG